MIATTLTPTPPHDPLQALPELSQLVHVAVLGTGAFGRVTLVKWSGKYYALKCMSKFLVQREGLT